MTTEDRFNSLIEALPKKPELWTMDDVESWLKLIRMDKYLEKFREMAIDGYLILDLTEEDLVEELCINIKLHRRKLIKAIGLLKDYSLHLDQGKMGKDQSLYPESQFVYTNNPHLLQNQIHCSNPGGNQPFGETLKSINMSAGQNRNEFLEENNKKGTMTNEKREELDYALKRESSDMSREDMIDYEEARIEDNLGRDADNLYADMVEVADGMQLGVKKEKKKELIIQPIEGPQTNFYYIKDTGGRIGRHSMNEVVIYDESVSRHHAEIVFHDDEFFLRDIGSTTGTYIKIIQKIDLVEGMIIEIGSYQFLVTEIMINLGGRMMEHEGINREKSYITLEIYDGPEDCEKMKHILEEGGSIGRKVNNKIHFTEDLHMSNLHCRITRVQDKFVLEDMASTNGLSKETEESDEIVLHDKSIFKIGNSAMYIAKRIYNSENLENQIGAINSSKKSLCKGTECYICCDNERNCLILPCRHNVSCMKCTKSMRECPICRVEIGDMVKIYKS